MITLSRLLPLLLALLLSACMAGPNAADVEADRARWVAVHEVTGDGVLDDLERARLHGVLDAWNEKLIEDETAVGRAPQLVPTLLRVYGAAALTVFSPELQAKHPDLFAVLDANADGLLTTAEVMAFVPRGPADQERLAMIAVFTLRALLKR